MQPIVVVIRHLHDTMMDSMFVVRIVVAVPPTPNVNGTAQQPLHSTVNQQTPVSPHRMNVDKQTPVKLLLHQNSKQKQTFLSFSVMPSMQRAHTSDTKLQKQAAQQMTPTSHPSSLSVLLSNIQQHSTLAPTLSLVSTVQQPTPTVPSLTTA